MPASGARVAKGLAEAFLAGPWEPDAMAERARVILGATRRALWIPRLAARVVEAFGTVPPHPRVRVLKRFLEGRPEFRSRVRQWLLPGNGGVPTVDLLGLPAPEMTPAPGLANGASLPPLTTPGRLADWLGLTLSELDWFADTAGLLSRRALRDDEPLRHYRWERAGKPRGRFRLLEIPKPRLKAIQRRILTDLLDSVPVHPAAHAFRRGRSIVSCVQPHVGREVVLAVDLREFFPSIHAGRVHATFRMLGFPERVARLLTGLCTTRTPEHLLDETKCDHRTRQFLRTSHLPQGAPTSPALANLCAWRLDCRLAGLARKFDADYTRYADDLIFSGGRDLRRAMGRLRIAACAIVLDEGFTLHRRKTRVMPRARQQKVGGLVINGRTNVPREEVEQLRATLFNCVRFGPASQNRTGHPRFREFLRGRIAWVAAANPDRATRLLRLFERIRWIESGHEVSRESDSVPSE